jgi:hypothetical protein
MNHDNPPGRSGGGPPGQQGLRLLAMLNVLAGVTVLAGVLALAAAAFVFSYAPVYDLARAAGVRPELARFYPAVPDAVLVVACAAALALRGARWWARWLVWMSIIALVALIGAADAAHAIAYKLPRRPAAAAVAVLPWALLLLGFRLWLSVLRHTRRDQRPATGPAMASPVASAAAAGPAADAADHDERVFVPERPDPATSPATTSPAASPATSPATDGQSSDGQSSDGQSAGDQPVAAGGLDLILPPYPEEATPSCEPTHPGEPSYAGEPRRADAAPAPAPLLGAPVPDAPPGEAAPSAASAPRTPEKPRTPERGAAQTSVREPDAATDFQRVRSSPVPPDEPVRLEE